MLQKPTSYILCLCSSGDSSSKVVAGTMTTLAGRVGLHRLKFESIEMSNQIGDRSVLSKFGKYICFLCSREANRDCLLNQGINRNRIFVVNESAGGLPYLPKRDYYKMIEEVAELINSQAHTIFPFIRRQCSSLNHLVAR